MAQPPANESCGNCKFFIEYQGYTFCRRFPPTTTLDARQTLQYQTTWPQVKAEHWCGEWVQAT